MPVLKGDKRFFIEPLDADTNRRLGTGGLPCMEHHKIRDINRQKRDVYECTEEQVKFALKSKKSEGLSFNVWRMNAQEELIPWSPRLRRQKANITQRVRHAKRIVKKAQTKPSRKEKARSRS